MRTNLERLTCPSRNRRGVLEPYRLRLVVIRADCSERIAGHRPPCDGRVSGNHSTCRALDTLDPPPEIYRSVHISLEPDRAGSVSTGFPDNAAPGRDTAHCRVFWCRDIHGVHASIMPNHDCHTHARLPRRPTQTRWYLR